MINTMSISNTTSYGFSISPVNSGNLLKINISNLNTSSNKFKEKTLFNVF